MDRCREVADSGGSTVFFSSNNIQYATVSRIIINPWPILQTQKKDARYARRERVNEEPVLGSVIRIRSRNGTRERRLETGAHFQVRSRRNWNYFSCLHVVDLTWEFKGPCLHVKIIDCLFVDYSIQEHPHYRAKLFTSFLMLLHNRFCGLAPPYGKVTVNLTAELDVILYLIRRLFWIQRFCLIE